MSCNKLEREIIFPKGNATPIAPYSPGVRVGNTLYVSGQIGMNPATNELIPGGIVPETEQAMKNLGNILASAGIDYSNVVKCTVLLADYDDFTAMNETYKKYFTQGKLPARVCYAVKTLPKHCRVEIDAIAIVGELQEGVKSA